MKRAAALVLLAAALSAPVALIVRPSLVSKLASGPQSAERARDEAFTQAFLRVLEDKAPRNPEAADALKFYRSHGWIRLHAARLEEEPVSGAGERALGALDVWHTLSMADLSGRRFLDSRGRLLPERELRFALERAAPTLIHETSHFRTVEALRFDVFGTLQEELLAFLREKRYLAAESPPPEWLLAAARARLDFDLAADPERKADARARASLLPSPEKTLGQDVAQHALLAAASPEELCRALAKPFWYGTTARDLEAPPERRPRWTSDQRRLETARAYFRAELGPLESCFSATGPR